MKNEHLLQLFAAVVLAGNLQAATPIGTAFTYQGKLVSAGQPLSGYYDLSFSLFDVASGGSAIASPVTADAVPVNGGLFTVTLDFGSAALAGNSLWLQINVRTNGSGTYETLVPRQPLTPAPYSVFASRAGSASSAGSAPASGISGTLATAQLPSNLAYLNAAQTFTGANMFKNASDNGASVRIGANVAGSNPKLLCFGDGQYVTLGENFEDDRLELTAAKFVFTAPYGWGYVGIGKTNPASQLDVAGTVTSSGLSVNGASYLNGNNFFFRGAGDQNHGLGWYGAGKGFTGFSSDGPVLFGCSGGGLGTECGTERLALQWDSAGNVAIDPGNANSGALLPGLTFGLASGEGISSKRTTTGNQYGLDFYTGYTPRMSIDRLGRVGIGTTAPSDSTLDVRGDIRLNDCKLLLRGGSDRNHGITWRDSVSGIGIDGPFIYGWSGGGLGTTGPDGISLKWDYTGNVWISNNCSVASLTVRGGADLAEPFPVSGDAIEAGAVMIIDPDHPGQVKLSSEAYDKRVAGIVSGAGGVNPGIQMHQEGLLEKGRNVALSGRVYALADASNGPIRPGDLLTTSSLPGRAMKVTDHAKAQGAILGKAMTALPQGHGTVLVLVTLQ